ncbi:gamma-glutamyltransferase family protein [Methylobacterium oxalidis]|uniref:Gamma-glutamyltranspeptidase n=1 Tax=Methylobacterium oxalidis TaxID=944322 RepID=A0A512IYQ3_9HYPH|nr:gamma-glutamyltransferase family protein [Methylobacterium oxalidis]GEP02783.1 gamma-glutamyltranspeptidase [Methylobacterium oxalidis]GJE34277.1 Oxamate amidohydrolase proenzyme [Methylobacterium oxalidis]GLS66817.1 gamma-glutamyltranspeptidase [Methylobacterium oxalidis]
MPETLSPRFESPETPTFAHGAVAAPHSLAAEAGRTVLAQGGNAVEAMIAMAAAIAVVYPHMNGIGGDGFWLVREPGGRVRGIEACGPAGRLATIARYRDRGLDAIPARGPDAAVTVAGAVGGWGMAEALARALGGRLPRDVLLADAIRHAREGCAVSASEARYVPKELDTLHDAPNFAPTFLKEGRPWPAGEIRRLPALAATLEQLAHAGLDDFYRGDIGREIAADLERLGAPVTRADLEAYAPRERAALSIRRRGATIFNFPPPTQGLAALLILGIFDRLDIREPETAAHYHGLIEATKRAFAIRDRVVTDFDRLRADPAAFLTPDRLAREAAAIDMGRAAAVPLRNPGEGDTVWMGAIDRDGVAVSYIQSIYWEYGSGTVLPATGIHWQNRGMSFSLDPNAVNPLEPGRRPFHTLIPALATFDDGRVVAYGSMGGDGQPQFQAQVFTRYADYGMSPAAAVDAPRLLYGRTWGAESLTVKVEDRFDPGCIAALRRMGHDIEELGGAYIDSLGHAGILVRHPGDGRIEAMHDPRSDGGALGL